MSCVGPTTGSPLEGDRRLAVDSIIRRASSCAARESGTWTAIWSPSKSALKAKQTNGWIWMAEPSTRTGMKAWMPRRCSVGARLSSTGWSLMTSSSTSQTSGRTRVDDALGALDVVGEALLDELAHDERLEQLERHLLGQPALVQLELGADDDDRPARVVDALAQQVLAEAALLALEHVGQALQAMVAGAADGAAAAAVVDQRVARLLEHALLVANDDLGRAQLEQPLQAVVAVDDAAVEVVQVGRGETAAVELDHWAQVGRNNGQDGQDHPLGPVAAAPEGLDQAKPLDRLLAPLSGRGADLGMEPLAQFVELHPADQLAYRFGAHAGTEQARTTAHTRTVFAVKFAIAEAIERRLGQQHARLESLDLVARAADLFLRPLGLALEAFLLSLDGGVVLKPLILDLAAHAVFLEGLALLDLGIDPFDLGGGGLVETRHGALAALVTGAHDHFAGGGEDDRLGGSGTAQLLDLGVGRLLRLDELGGQGRALLLALALEGGQPFVELVLAPVEVGQQLVFEVGQRLSAAATTAFGFLFELGSMRARASSSTQVTMYRAK